MSCRGASAYVGADAQWASNSLACAAGIPQIEACICCWHLTHMATAAGVQVPAVELLRDFPPGLWAKLHTVRHKAAATAEAQMFEQLTGG